jgi:hypothetical protein
MLFFFSYKILGYGCVITFLSSCYNSNTRQLENLSNVFNGQINFFSFQFYGLFYDSVIANHLRSHKQIDVSLIELAHMSEPYFLPPLCFMILDHPYHVVHATYEINRFKIFRLNRLLQLLYLSTL